MRKPLITTESPLYLKRLARELNSLPDGFYAPIAAHHVRCNRARVRGGVLEVRCPVCSPAWFAPSYNTFSTPYGETVCASRRA